MTLVLMKELEKQRKLQKNVCSAQELKSVATKLSSPNNVENRKAKRDF